MSSSLHMNMWNLWDCILSFTFAMRILSVFVQCWTIKQYWGEKKKKKRIAYQMFKNVLWHSTWGLQNLRFIYWLLRPFFFLISCVCVTMDSNCWSFRCAFSSVLCPFGCVLLPGHHHGPLPVAHHSAKEVFKNRTIFSWNYKEGERCMLAFKLFWMPTPNRPASVWEQASVSAIYVLMKWIC